MRPGRGEIPWPPMAVALLCAAAYCLFLVWPYYANGVQQLTLTELDAAPNASVLWPYSDPGPLGLFFTIGGAFAVTLVPLLVIAVAVWAGTWMVLEWELLDRRGRALLVAAVVVAVAVLVLRITPLGTAL